MAPFNKDVSPINEPNYLRESRPVTQFEGNKAAAYAGEAAGATLKGEGAGLQGEGALASAAGSIFKDVVKAGDDYTKATIDENVRAVIDDERGGLTANLVKMRDSGRTPPSIFGDSGDGMDAYAQAAPTEVDNELDRVGTIKSAGESGKFPLSYLHQRIDTKLSELRDRYPGYKDYIDKKSESMGFDSANKFWQSMISEMNNKASVEQRERTRLVNDAKKYLEEGVPNADVALQGVLSGKIQDRAQYFNTMGSDIYQHGQLKNRNLQLSVQKAETEQYWKLNEAVAEAFGTQQAHKFYNGMFINLGIDGQDGKTAAQIAERIERNAGSDIKMPPTEALATRQYGQALYQRAERQLREMYQLPTNAEGMPDPKGKYPSLATRMGPDASTKIDSIISKTVKPMFTSMLDNLTDGNVSAAGFNGLWAKAKQDMFSSNMMQNYDVSQMMHMQYFLKDTPEYGKDWFKMQINEAARKPDMFLGWQVGLSNAKTDAMMDPSVSQVLSQKQIVQQMKMTGLSVYDSKDYKSVVDLANQITNPKASDRLKMNIAHRAFFPDNKGFLNEFRTEDKPYVLNTMASPDVLKEMYRLGTFDPRYWDSTKNWVKEEFGNNLLHQEIKELSKINHKDLKVSWNTVTNNWDLYVGQVPTPDKVASNPITDAQKGTLKPMQVYDQVLESEYNKAKDIVSRVNAGLNAVANIPKVDKTEGSVSSFLLRTMRSVNPDIAKIPGITGDMFRTVEAAQKAEVAPPQKAPQSPSGGRTGDKTKSGSIPTPEEIPHYQAPERVPTIREWQRMLEGVKAPNRSEVKSSKKVWGDREAEDEGLYEKPKKK